MVGVISWTQSQTKWFALAAINTSCWQHTPTCTPARSCVLPRHILTDCLTASPWNAPKQPIRSATDMWMLMALDSYLNTGTVACKCLWQSRPHELVWSRSSQGKIAKPPHTKPKYIHLVLLWGASSRSMVTSGSLLRHWCCCLMAEMPWSTERGDHEANTSLSPNSRVVQRSWPSRVPLQGCARRNNRRCDMATFCRLPHRNYMCKLWSSRSIIRSKKNRIRSYIHDENERLHPWTKNLSLGYLRWRYPHRLKVAKSHVWPTTASIRSLFTVPMHMQRFEA